MTSCWHRRSSATLPAGVCPRARAGGAARLALGKRCQQFARCSWLPVPSREFARAAELLSKYTAERTHGGPSRASSILPAAPRSPAARWSWGQAQGSWKKGDAPKLEHITVYENEVCGPQNGADSGQHKRWHSRHEGVAVPAWLPQVPSKRLPHPHSHAPCGAGTNVYVHECFRNYHQGFLSIFFLYKQTFSWRFPPCPRSWGAPTQGWKTCTSREPTLCCSHPGQKWATGRLSPSLIGAKSVSYAILQERISSGEADPRQGVVWVVRMLWLREAG